jgi:hypothetical protein
MVVAAARITHTELPRSATLTAEDSNRLLNYRNRQPFPLRTEGSVPSITCGAPLTLRKYNLALKQLSQFCLLVRCDQSSLLLSRDVCPDMPPPIVPSTLCAFLSYKILKTGEFVTHHLTGTTVADYHGDLIRADGGWNCSTNLEAATSAIKRLCNLYPSLLGEGVPYQAACPLCISRYSQQQNDPTTRTSVPQPCTQCSVLHGQTAQIIPKGCVLNDEGVKQHIQMLKIQMKDHVRRGCIQLMPSDVRHIRDHLLHLRPGERCISLNNLQIYCMFLVGINLFLRSEELLKLQFSDFVPDYTYFQGERMKIQCLVFQVQGKSDHQLQYLRLWANNSHPELCPVIHLLIYIAMSGRTEGFLFPSTDNANNIFDYSKFLDIVKRLCVDICGYDEQIRRFGTHILRKTAYLFAIFGTLTQHGAINFTHQNGFCGVTLTDIMASARHKSNQNAATYAQDCVTTYHSINLAGACSSRQTANRYMEWNPIHSHTLLALERSTPGSLFVGKSLQFCAKWFYETKLRLTTATSVLSAVTSAANSVSLTQQSTQNALQKLQAMMLAKFTPEEVAVADVYLQQIATQNVIDSNTSTPSSNSETAAQEILPIQQDQQPQTAIARTPSRPAKKQRIHHYGNVDLEFRLAGTWDNFDLTTQVERLVHCYTIPSKELTNAAKSFVSLTAAPIARCVEQCYKKDIPKFLIHLSDLGITNIKKGKGKYACTQCPSSKRTK